MNTQLLIDNANAYLKTQFKAKHKLITPADVEAVYGRSVLSVQADAKTSKGLTQGYLTGIMYLAPASLIGVNLCPKSSAGCRSACLFSAGRGRFYSTNRARIVKTLAYLSDPARFTETIKASIRTLERKAKRLGLIPCVRLNGTSDIVWELKHKDIFDSFPTMQFYDYTKIAKRFMLERPKNYHLTFSLSESNDIDALYVLSKRGNIAAVFSGGMPEMFMGYACVNGDASDLRFLDPANVWYALSLRVWLSGILPVLYVRLILITWKRRYNMLRLLVMFGFHGRRHAARERRIKEILAMIGE